MSKSIRKRQKDGSARGVESAPVSFSFLSRGSWVTSLFLIAIVFAAYWPATDSDFVTYDDNDYVTQNWIVQEGLTHEGLSWAFTTTHQSNWHPLTWLSHMLDFTLYGMNARGHHLNSIIFHATNAVLLLFALHLMTGSLWRSGIVALLFALHPLQVESVAWVAERKSVLSTLFWMITLLVYALYAKRPGVRRYAIAMIAFGLGLMAKPMLVTLPFQLLLLDYWPLHRLNANSDAGTYQTIAWTKIRALIVEKVPIFLLAAVSSGVTYWAQQKGGAVSSLQEVPFGIRFENGLMSYVKYIERIFYPHDLAPFYPYPTHELPIWQVGLAGLLLILATICAISVRRSKPYVPVGWFWYLGTLVPVLGLVQVGSQSMADRYAYMPLIGIAIVIAWSVPDFSLCLVKRGKVDKKIAAALILAGGLLMLLLLAATRLQVGYWHDSVSLFKHSLDVTRSNYTAHTNLGLALAQKGMEAEAITHYYEALALRPDGQEVLNNLAWLLATSKNESLRNGAEAVQLANRACELTGFADPTFLDSLAAAYAEAGRYEEAIRTEGKAISFARSLKLGEPVAVLEERLHMYQSHRPYRALPTNTGQ